MNTAEHLLECLQEECAEIIKDAAKANQFGLDDINPLKPEGPTNKEKIVTELNDLMAIVGMLAERGIISDYWYDQTAINAKKLKVAQFMNYAAKNGTLHDVHHERPEGRKHKNAPPVDWAND